MGADYFRVDDMLADFDPTETLAFVHGSLMARLICGERMKREEWLDSVRDLLEIEAPWTEDQADLLQAVYDDALAALPVAPTPDAPGPAPLLPDDESPLADRLEALADWCAAFVSTLGMVGQLNAPDEEDQDILSDLIAISQLDPASAADTESDDPEEDFLALRLHVQLANRHFYERFAPPGADTPLH